MVLYKIFLTAAFGLLFSFSSAQTEGNNYRVIFSKDYERAAAFFKNEKWIDELIVSYHLNPKSIKAVVFPELIRYNSLQDKIETFALESLYIQYGKAYADFSVGEFQIKPSFAENIEIDFLKLFEEVKTTKSWCPSPDDTIQNSANRATRLKRIKNKKLMVSYICLFFKVMEAKYPRWKNDEEKIKFFACAYNLGYGKSKEEINVFISKKFFHTGLASISKKYCYASIAWYSFQQKD